jgi:hypothetical protein
MAAQDELLNRVGKSFCFVGGGNVIGLLLHFSAGVAHGNAQPATLKHGYIVGHIADGGNFRSGNVQQLREAIDHGSLVGLGMGDIQVVGLRSRCRHLFSSRQMASCLTAKLRAKGLLHILPVLANPPHSGLLVTDEIEILTLVQIGGVEVPLTLLQG